MTYRNRVTPAGTIETSDARGLFTGNRGGKIHDPTTGALVPRRRWTGKAWICCLLAFRGRRRQVMGPGYTHLFFLDEVTALAAGHRPCYECRRSDAAAFAAAWAEYCGLGKPPSAGSIDAALHGQRRAVTGACPVLPIDRMADGTMIMDTGSAPRVLAIRGGRLLQWSHHGYTDAGPRPGSGAWQVLTPAGTAGALAAGYLPRWHPSASR